MRILTHTQIGTHHANHNEDAYAVAELTDSHRLLATINGTAAGRKGYFTAALVAQLLEKIAGELSLQAFAEGGTLETSMLLKRCTRALFQELGKLQNRLNLSDEELRLTMTLGVVDGEQRNADFVIVGSGIISCDEDMVEMAQYTEPDYLCNHLDKDKSAFNDWWASHDKRVVCQDCLDVAIATPGILTFEPFSHDPYRPVTEDELLSFLLTERNDGPVEQLFRRKLLYIEDKFGLLPTDDVTIVRAFVLD